MTDFTPEAEDEINLWKLDVAAKKHLAEAITAFGHECNQASSPEIVESFRDGFNDIVRDAFSKGTISERDRARLIDISEKFANDCVGVLTNQGKKAAS